MESSGCGQDVASIEQSQGDELITIPQKVKR